jgi:bifunctional NMN adenylyltransferase/nudix hydrolase
MTNKKYDTSVVIMRAQPPHFAHVEIVRRALEIANQTNVIFGSSYLPRTYKNPFAFQERQMMLLWALDDEGIEDNIITVGAPDFNDNNAWAVHIQELVGKYAPGKTVLVGHMKDTSTFYLNMFPQWDRYDPGLIEPLNATDIRDLYFRTDTNFRYLENVVPKGTLEYLREFATKEDYKQIIREREHIENYRKQYQHLPYAPTFVTVDNVVIQSGHVLLVKRRAEPGKGLWALPGGFLDAENDASLEDAALRELKEETKIKIPVPVLRGSIKSNKVFDAKNRSARGRTITHAFYYILQDGELPKVKGSDDAEKACWIPIGEIKRETLFEDHFGIIQYGVNL